MTYVLTSTRIKVYAGATNILDNALGVTINAGTLTSAMIGNGRLTSGTLTQPVLGFMKDVLFFNAALTAQQVSDLYYSDIRPASLAASYRMEEGSGTNIADGTGSNSMTAASITWSSTMWPTTARTSLPRRSTILPTPYTINGVASTTSGLTIPNNAALNPTSAVTVRIRFMISGQNTHHSLFDNSQAGTTSSYFFDYYEAVGFRWYSTVGGLSKNIVGTTYRAPRGVWIDAVATYTGAAIFIYVNGVKLAEEITGISGALGTNSGPLRIGRSWNALATGALVGYIHRPMIFNVGCTLSEAQDMYYNDVFSASLQAGKVLDLAMTEGSGTTVADVSTTGAIATLGAAASWSGQFIPFNPRFVLRQYNYSLNFNGSSQYVTLGTSGSIAQSSAAFSVACWFKQNGAQSGLVTVVGDTDVALQRFYFQMTGNQMRAAIKTNGTSANMSGGIFYPSDQWVLGVLTYDGSNAKVYINNFLDQSVTCTRTCSASTAGVAIGRGFGAARYWNGNIARVQYWTRALSIQEIRDIYYLGSDSSDASIRTGMTGEWKLDEGSGTTAVDTFGSNNGTKTGATYVTDTPSKLRSSIT